MIEGVALLTIFVLSAFTGYEVISKVSTVLHTPLMSGANAIHGVILVGAILVSSQAEGAVEMVVAVLAVLLATLNLVGGFVVTDRMLHMFGNRRPAPATGGGPAKSAPSAQPKKSSLPKKGRGPAKKPAPAKQPPSQQAQPPQQAQQAQPESQQKPETDDQTKQQGASDG